MSKFFFPKLSVLILILFLGTGIFFLQIQNFNFQKETFRQISSQALFVPDGKKLKQLTFGYDNLITDLIWLKTIQYWGGNALSQNYHLLGQYLKSVTELDPRFYAPYYVAILILPEIGQTETAIQLAEKGMQALPERWEIPYYLGYLYYYYRGDYIKGSQMYSKVAQMPGALESARRMAVNLQSQAGKHQVALKMWLDIYQETQDLTMQKLLIKKITREKNFLDLEQAVQNFQNSSGYLPDSLEALTQAGFLTSIPTDPLEYWKKYHLKNGQIILE